MPIRQLPRTNSERMAAMQTIKGRLESPTLLSHPFRQATVDRLTAFFPVYAALLLDQRVAQSDQTGATVRLVKLRKMARIWVRQGYSSIIKAIVRGTFTRSVLSFYGLPLTAKGAPKMRSESAILSSATWLADGEAGRVAIGGTPIAFPSVAEIMVHADAFKVANLEQGTLKVAFADAQKAVAVANVEADRLILRLWNEIETAFDVGNPPNMRRKSREWGVVYVQGRAEPPSAETNAATGSITDAESGKALRAVRVQVIDHEYRIKSNARGHYSLPLLEPGEHVLLFKLKGYTTVQRNITIVEGKMAQVDVTVAAKAQD